MLKLRICLSAPALMLFLGLNSGFGWDYEAHRIVNQLALGSLPDEYPAFIRTPAAIERVAFLSGEPDRWRNTQDLPLKHFNGPDHYIDMEDLADYDLTPENLPVFRYDFVARLALFRAAHPDKFPTLDQTKDQDHTRQLVGLLPWGLAEYYGKLKSGFSYLKAYEQEGGTSGEIANAQANILYIMGSMGHLAGDASQPLHTTKHHHGWVGPNPNGYTTDRGIHSWIDGGYFAKTGGVDLQALKGRSRPARPVQIDGRPAKEEEIFQTVMLFLKEQNQTVEPLYRMEKEGKFAATSGSGLEGKAFLEGQLLKSGQLLGDLYLSAWRNAPPDTFLKGQLTKRKRTATSAP